MSCTKITFTNGAASTLYDTIYNQIADENTTVADIHYGFFQSDAFINDFGNWIEDYRNGDHVTNPRVDENGEPILFIDEFTDEFFYYNQFNDKIFFPGKSITTEFTQKEIDDTIGLIAREYFNAFNNNDGEISSNKMQDIESFTRDLLETFETEADIEERFDDLDSISTLKEFTPELADRIKEFYKNIGLNLTTFDESNDDFTDLEENDGALNTRDAAFSMSSMEKNPMNDLSTEVRQLLAFVTDENAPVTFLGEKPNIPLGKVYNQMMEILADTVPVNEDGTIKDLYQAYTEQVRQLSTINPSYVLLYHKLSAIAKDSPLRNKVVQAFNKSKNNYMHREINYNSQTGTTHVTYLMSDAGGGSKSLAKNNATIISELHINLDTNKPINEASAELFSTSIDNTQAIIDYVQDNNSGMTEGELKNYLTNYLIYAFDGFGINLKPSHFDYISKKLSVNELPDADMFANLLAFTKQLKSSLERIDLNFSAEKSLPFNLILENENTFNTVAKAQSFFNGSTSEGSIQLGGKPQYIYSNPSYLHTKVLIFKNNASILEAWNNANAYNKGSVLMPYLLGKDVTSNRRVDPVTQALERKQRLELFQDGIFASQIVNLDVKKGTNGAAKEMTESDYIVDNMNSVLDHQGFIRTTSPADKSTDRQLRTGFRIDDTLDATSETYGLNNIVKHMFKKYFFSEVERMREAWTDIQEAVASGDTSKLILHYHVNAKKQLIDDDGNFRVDALGNAFKSQLFDSLSPTSKHSKEGAIIAESLYNEIFIKGKGILTPAEVATTSFTSDLVTGNIIDINTNTEGVNFQRLVEDYVEHKLLQTIGEKVQVVNSNDIIMYNDDGTINIAKSKIDKNILGRYINNPHYSKLSHRNIASILLSDYVVNGMMHHVEYSKMFTGDFAYYKDMIDYKKRVPASYTDGLQLSLDEMNSEFTIAVTSAIMLGSPVVNEIAAYLGDKAAETYGEGQINSADAQAWITPERWKFLLEKMGKFGPVEQRVYEKLISTKEVEFDKDELKAAAQPLKGVYFQMNGTVPSYLKYSQAVISPNLTGKGSQFAKIYDMMKQGGVDELVTVDAFKVGSSIPDTIHNSDGTVKDNVVLNTRKLKNSGWKLQQDLPTKTFKELNVGSQIQKNIFAGLNFLMDEASFHVDTLKQTLKGSEVANQITETTQRLSDLGYKSLESEFGINASGVITNREAYNRAIIEELAERGNEDAILALQRGLSSYAIPSVGLKIDQIFASIITKRLIKIQTNGASLIQMSNFGISKEGSDSAIKWSPKIESGTTTYEPQFLKDENGDYVLENGRKVLKPAGVLVSGSFIAKYIPDYIKYSELELFGGTDENGNVVKPLIDPEILNKFLGYRIPNQGLSSNIAMEVVGILPPTHGDTIVAYTGITAQTGSDFDIDKMFIMIPSFRPSYNDYISHELNRKIIDKFFKGKNIRGTVDNIKLFLNEIGANLSYSDLLTSNIEKLREVSNELVSALKNSDNADVPKVREIMDFIQKEVPTFGELNGLKYIKPKGDIKSMNKKQAQNHLIELYKSVLLSEDVIADVMTSIDDDTIKNEVIRSAAASKANSSVDLFHVDPIRDIELLFSFRKGKLGVAQEANIMVDVNRMGQLSLINTNLGRGNYDRNTNSMLLDPAYSESLSSEDLYFHLKETYKGFTTDFPELSSSGSLSKLGNDPKYDKLKSYINQITKLRSATSYTSIMNAFVDIAKDPFITDGNWSSATTNAGNLLIRAGVHPFIVINMMSQPIIKEYVNFLSSNTEFGDSFSNFIRKIIVTEASKNYKGTESLNFELNGVKYDISLKSLAEKIDNTIGLSGDLIITFESLSGLYSIPMESLEGLGGSFRTIMTEMIDSINNASIKVKEARQNNASNFSLEALRKAQKTGSLNIQIPVLDYIREAQQLGKELNETMSLSRTDTDGLAGTLSSIYTIDNLKEHILNKEIIAKTNGLPAIGGYSSRIENTPLGAYLSNISKMTKIVNANPDLFPQSMTKVQNMFNDISFAIKGTPLIDTELAKKLESEFRAYTLGQYFNISTQEATDLLTLLPDELNKFKLKLKKEGIEGEYSIIDELFTEPSAWNRENAKDIMNEGLLAKVPTIISMSSRFKDKYHIANITDSWNRLYKDYPEFADRLFRYSYLTSSFQMRPGQFFNVAPHNMFVRNKFQGETIKTFNDVLLETLNDPSSFATEFFKNNSTDFKIVNSINSFNATTGRGMKYQGSTKTGVVESTDPLKPFVNYKLSKDQTVLMQLMGVKEGHEDSFVGHYQVVQRKGYQGSNIKINIKDYSKDGGFSEALLSHNMSLFYANVTPDNSTTLMKPSEYYDYLRTTDTDQKLSSDIDTSGSGSLPAVISSIPTTMSPEIADFYSIEPLSNGSVVKYNKDDQYYIIVGKTPNGLLKIMKLTSTDQSNRKLSVKAGSLSETQVPKANVHNTSKGIMLSVNTTQGTIYIDDKFKFTTEESFNSLLAVEDKQINDGIKPKGDNGINPQVKETNLGFKLNDRQQEVKDSIMAFLNSSESVMMLKGKAGTGKTTVMTQVISEIANDKKVLITAVSHQATNVLTDKTVQAMGGVRKITSASVAGALGAKMNDETGEFTFPESTAFTRSIIENMDVAIVDEASMINEQALDLLMSSGVKKIIFVGDPGQLSPIRKNDNPNQGKSSPVFDLENSLELYERMRQGEESSILPYADHYWNNGMQESGSLIDPVPAESRVNSKDMTFVKNSAGVLKPYLSKFKEAIDNKEPNLIRVVTYHNALRTQVNKYIRESIFDNPEPFELNEPLVFFRGYSTIMKNNDARDPVSINVEFANSRTILATNVEYETVDDLPSAYLTVDMGNEFTARVLTVLPEHVHKYKERVNELYEIAMSFPPKSRQRREAFDVKNKFEQKFALLDYGYAITSHKSQGSTYNTTIVHEDDIMSNNHASARDKSKAMYTAITRSSEHTIIISNKNGEIKVSNSTGNGSTKGAVNNASKQGFGEIIQNITYNPSEYVNHSGGAIGSDSMWDEIGQSFGVVNHKHYYQGEMTPKGNSPISYTDTVEGQRKATEAGRIMGRLEPTHNAQNEKLIRNWSQVKYADSVIAIGTMVNTGAELRYGKIAKVPQVEGGTGWAVQMAINEGKPVTMFDQVRNQWYSYNYEKGGWVKSGIPKLTKNFAGIGTQQINQAGVEAIRSVYANTFENNNTPVSESNNIEKVSTVNQTSLDFGTMTTTEKLNALPPLAKTKIKEITDNINFLTLTEDQKYYEDNRTKVKYNRVTKTLSTEEKIDYLADDFTLLEDMGAFITNSDGNIVIADDAFAKITEIAATGNTLYEKGLYDRVLKQSTALVRFKTATIVGNKIDIFIRNFFDNGTLTVDMLNEVSTRPSVQQAMMASARTMKEYFDSRGEVVIPKDVTLFNPIFKVAGTVDLMTVDAQGNFRIYDIKTNKDVGTLTKEYNDTDHLGDSVADSFKPSKMAKYSKQVNVYRTLLNNTHGISAVELGLFVLDVDYDGSNGNSEIQGIVFDTKRIIPVEITNEVVPFGAEEAVAESGDLYKTLTSAQKFDSFGVMTHLDSVTIDVTSMDGKQSSLLKFVYAHKAMIEAKYGVNGLKEVFAMLQQQKVPLQSLNTDYLIKCLKG